MRATGAGWGSVTANQSSPSGCPSSVVTAAYVLLRGLPKDFRRAYLRLVLRTLRARPDQLAGTLELLVFGCHFHRFTLDHVLPQLDAELACMPDPLEQAEPLTLAG